MRLKLLRLFAISGCFVLLSNSLNAQSCIPTGIQGMVINLNCNQVCSTLVFPVPHIKSTDDYTLVNTPYAPYPYVTASGSEDPTLYNDDQYSNVITLPFTACFYGATYPTVVVGSNGIMTFDPANGVAGCANAWPITTTIPFAGGTICASASTYYPRASIMGAYSDLDPRTVASPASRKIQWDVFGTAPCRKFVVSYFNIGVFGNTCGIATPNTFQMVIHESTGIVEIFTEQKACGSTTNAGRGILGIQNWNRDAAIAAPGKNNTFWSENNTGYRFIPSAGTSRYIISEMLDMSGNVVATADTLTTVAGLLDIRYQNFCTPPGSTQFVVRTQFSACDNPANLLVSLDTITINRTNSLGATHTTTDAGCGTGGTITVNVPAGVGTAPYTYILDGGTPVTGPSPYTFTNVAAGAHTVVVTDASAGCTSTITPIQVNLVGTISETHTMTPAICAGSPTGSITISSAGGTGPYTFSLNGGPAVPGTLPFTFNNLLPAGYSIQVFDLGTGCNTGLQPVFVSAGGGVTGTSSHTDAVCTGVNNGTLTATATSGTGPYTWSLDGAPAVPGTSPYTFTGLSPGLHYVIITDLASGCSSAGLFETVATGPGVTGNTSAVSTSCAAAGDGSITVNITAGTAPYTYVLDGGAPVTGGSPYTFNGVTAGLHNITVTDANGCTNPLPPINVNAGVGVTGNTSSLSTSCPSAANGSITVNITTGAAPYTYVLDGGAPVTGGSPYTFNAVAAGAHTIDVTDNNGCNVSLPPVNVNAGPALTGNNVMAATSCSGAADGTVTVTPVGGVGPYTFSLDGGAPQTGPVPFVFTGLTAGPHSVVITDAAGCQSNPIDATIAAGPALTTTANATAALCNGSATGSITVTAPTMGVGPYQYSLNAVTWQGSNIFNGLVANTYTVYYQSANGCSGSTPGIVVSAPASVSASHTTTPVSCNGLSDGTITITANGGVPPYQYSIDGGATWQASNVFTVPANNYPNILIRDANNCTTTQSAIVTQPATLLATATATNATCNGGADGTITVTAVGGNAGYQYSLDGVNFQSSNVFNVIAGTYTVTVRDNKGCITTTTGPVNLTNDLTFTPMVDETICEGTSVQLNIVSNGLQYAWTPATGLSNAAIANPVANPTTTTTYTVTITRGLCTTTDNVIVNVNPAPVPNAGPDGFICYGQTYTLQGSGGVQYTWTPSTYLNDATIANPLSNPARTITYTLSEVIDALGCKSLKTDVVTVDVTPPIKVTTYPFDTVVYAGDQFQLNATSIANIYTWSPAVGLSNPNIANPVATAGLVGSEIIYQVTASTVAGCKGEGYVRVKVYTGPDIYMATGFTPNGDGKNDKFTPFPVGVVGIKYFRIYNRGGQLVFSSNKLHEGWDGKLGGVEQATGVYVWMVEGLTKDNKVITKKGTVTLIR